MPRKTPTINVDTLPNYDADPIRDNPEYLASKEYEKWFMKPPCFDTVGNDIEALYIDKKVEFAIAQDQRNALRKEQHWLRKVNAQRTRVIKRDHDMLHDGFVKLNNFIRDSDEKKKAAMRKINIEMEFHEEIKGNIEQKKRMMGELALFRDEIRYTTEQYKLYETVLDRAFKKSGIFESVKDMTNRCDAIMLAQGEIDFLSNKLCGEIEHMRKRILDIVKQAELFALGLKNELTELERSYIKAKMDSLSWETYYTRIRHSILDNELEKWTTRDAVNGLYRLLCARSGVIPSLARSEIEKQLDYIRDEVDILRQTLKQCNKGKENTTLKVKPIC